MPVTKATKIKTWCIVGFFVVVLLGYFLHFVFHWTNQSAFVGIFVPVNESAWEHLKLGFWSLVIFSSIEYGAIKGLTNNYLLSKALGATIISSTILVIFYAYTGVTGRSYVIVDIASYIVGVFFCQLAVYALLKRPALNKVLNVAGLALLLVSALLLAIFTFYPPHYDIFMDKNNHTYGITKEKIINEGL